MLASRRNKSLPGGRLLLAAGMLSMDLLDFSAILAILATGGPPALISRDILFPAT
jgi:hypothetical protein